MEVGEEGVWVMKLWVDMPTLKGQLLLIWRRAGGWQHGAGWDTPLQGGCSYLSLHPFALAFRQPVIHSAPSLNNTAASLDSTVVSDCAWQHRCIWLCLTVRKSNRKKHAAILLFQNTRWITSVIIHPSALQAPYVTPVNVASVTREQKWMAHYVVCLCLSPCLSLSPSVCIPLSPPPSLSPVLVN